MLAGIPIQKAFGSYIAERRQEAGLHVEQLAEISGLSGNRLNAIERGEVNLNLGTILILAMSLGTSPQQLFSETAGRIEGSHKSLPGNASDSSAFLYTQIKPKQLWIGAVEVRPLDGCEVLDYTQEAFVNIVTWAADAYEYGERVAKALGELRLFVMAIEAAEPVQTKRQRDGTFEVWIEEIISDAERNPNTTLCGEFYTFAKTDA